MNKIPYTMKTKKVLVASWAGTALFFSGVVAWRRYTSEFWFHGKRTQT